MLISTQTSLPVGNGPNDAGPSRLRLIRAVEDTLKRLGTDYIDLFQLHASDAETPIVIDRARCGPSSSRFPPAH